MEIFDDVISYFIYLLLLINAAIYCFESCITKSSVTLRWLTGYLVIGCLLQYLMWYLALGHNNNLWVAHIYFTMQFIFLSFFYKSMFIKAQQQLVVGVIFVVLLILGYYYISDPTRIFTFNLLDTFILSMPIIAYSIIYLYNSLTKQADYLFVNSAIFIYFSISTLIFFLGKVIHTEEAPTSTIVLVGRRIWYINNMIFLLYNIAMFLEWKLNISKWKAKKIF